MKKICKLLLTLSLVGQVLLSNASSHAEEQTEEANVDEVVDETVEESESVEAAEVIELTPVDNPEEVIAMITEKNSEPQPKATTGVATLGFAGENNQSGLLMGLDYYLKYNIEPRLSAEFDFNFKSILTGDPYHIFAYVHNGKLLEYREETWYSDDFSQYEEMFTSLLTETKDMSEFHTKYMDVLQSPDSYILRLKDDIDISEFFADLNTIFDLETIKNELLVLMNADENFDILNEDILNILFSEEKLQETLANESVVEFIFNQESGYLINTYVNLSVPVSDIFEKLEMDPAEMPSNLHLLMESSNSNIGEQSDFTFLDEVAPAE